MANKSIKLLKFVSAFAIGGTEKQFVQLARSIDRDRFDLSIACLQRFGQLLTEMEASGVPLDEYRINSLHNHVTLREQVRFARDIRRRGIDIVHTYGFYANVFAILPARMARGPLVVASIRDTGVYLTEMQKRVQRLVCRFADHILVNAEAVKSWLVQTGYRPDKITVIHNGIVPVVPPPGITPEALRRDLGFRSDTSIVAVHCRLSEMKGIDYFLDAASLILERFPHTRFLVIGDGNHKKSLEEHAARAGIQDRVVFTGFRLDMSALLSAITISVSPSLSEGLSNSLLEALAAAIPVVATRVGGNPELILDGVTGLLIPPRDPVALAAAVSRLLADPDFGTSLGRAGREMILSRFSMAQAVRRTELFYQDLFERRPRQVRPRAREAA
jgi:glycosyltransferase involved in cell wall biosynthesis